MADTILAVKWHEIRGLKEILTPKLVADSEADHAPGVSVEVAENREELMPPQPSCSASPSTNENPVHETNNRQGSEELVGQEELPLLSASGKLHTCYP